MPVALVVLFTLGLVAHYAAPWAVLGMEDRDTQYRWAHEYVPMGESPFGTFLPVGLIEPNPVDLSLWGLVAGIAISFAWIVAVKRIPPESLTARRDAAFAATLAIPTFMVAVAGSRGLGQMLHAGASTTAIDVWGFSIAGAILMGIALVAALVVASALGARMPGRLTPAAILVLSIVGVGAFHAVPWITSFQGDDVTHSFRDSTAILSADPLASLELALLLLLLAGVAWVLVAAAVPDSPRHRHAVDGLGAAALAPSILLGAIGTGDLLGLWLSSILDTRPQWSISINAFVFVGFLAGLVLIAVTTVARSARAAEEVGA